MKPAALSALLLLAAAPAMAQDVDAGRELAEKWCAGCHNVLPGVRAVKEGAAPPFQVVAESKGMTQTALQVFLVSNHVRMPEYSLTRQELREVSAYIVSLKK
jgi:mono/diheme cytochrome c family protein